ncbi:MAG: nucleotidyltransferase domain-containing protein [Candidatus Aenigmatarchaeota archaeon]
MDIENLEKELEDVKLAKKEKEEIKVPSDVIAKVVKFTNDARKQYGDIVKSVVIFGSAVKGTMTKGSDVDAFVILDDTATKSTEDFEKIISHLYLMAHELKDLHIQVHALTKFWEWIRHGSPELVNFLRYGLAIYDTGFIKPIQRMLQMGLIPPSEETISLKAKASEARLKKIKLDLKAIVFDLRYTAIDMIQSAVMFHYKAQPDPKDIPKFLERLVKENKLEEEYIEKFKELDKLWKDIDHKIVKDVRGEYLEKTLQLTEKIVERFKKLIPKEVLGEELSEIEE